MKLQFLLAGIVATGLFASAPDTVAHGGFGGGGGHGGGGFHGGGGGFHGGRFGDFHGARFGEFRDHRVFFQQFAWPIYWYPYYPYDYSYLDYGPDNNYQYWDSSAASVQPESFRPAADHGPVVVVINTGNSRPMDSRANTAYVNSGYSSTDAEGQQRIPLSFKKIGVRMM